MRTSAVCCSQIVWSGGEVEHSPRSDESICSRCLGEDALTLVPPSADDDGEADSGAAADLGGHVIVDAAVELVTPRRQGTYRIFFRLVVGTGESMAPVAGCDELFAEFVVVE